MGEVISPVEQARRRVEAKSTIHLKLLFGEELIQCALVGEHWIMLAVMANVVVLVTSE